jgi:hypothetical protein
MIQLYVVHWRLLGIGQMEKIEVNHFVEHEMRNLYKLLIQYSHQDVFHFIVLRTSQMYNFHERACLHSLML